MRAALLAVLALTACQLPPPSESTSEQGLVNGVGFSPASGGTVGDVQVGQTSAPWGIAVYPTGTTGDVSYTINSITGCNDFPIDAPGLPAEIHRTCLYYCSGTACTAAQLQAPICEEWDINEYDFSAYFRPGAQGPSSCGIVLDITGLGAKTYVLNGNGTLPPKAMAVTPTQIAFGDVRRNTTSSGAVVHVRNSGGQGLTISAAQVTAGFQMQGPMTGTIAVGATQDYTLACSPTATGPLSGSFRITTDAPQSPVSVSLSCNGIDSALDVSPSPANVPTTRVGEPASRSVRLINSGAAPMTIEGATFTGAGLSASGLPGAGDVIAPGGEVDVTIAFAAAAAGDATGSLDVTFDGGQTRSVPVSAKALATSMSVSPDGVVDLGPVCVGQSNATQVNIAANAEGDFLVTNIAAPDAPFAVSSPSLPATVVGSGANHVSLDVSVAPTAPGALTSTISIVTDIPNAEPHVLALTATGLPAGVSATPEELDLGPVMIDKTTIGQEIDLTNCSTSASELTNPRIDGPDAAEFAIVQQPNSLTLDANGNASFLVIAAPHTVGAKSAAFSVDYPGGTATVALSANGLGDNPGGGDDTGGGDSRPSYYACSIGGGAGLAGAMPIGLALGALLVRRRRRGAPRRERRSGGGVTGARAGA